MKVMGFDGIVRNGQFVDALFSVSLTECDQYNLDINSNNALLSVTYDKEAKCIIIGVLDGGDIIMTDLTDQEKDDVNSWIDKLGIYDEIIEIVNIMKKVS